MVLRGSREQTPKVLAGRVVSRNDKVGTLNTHINWILRVLKLDLLQDEVLRVWKTLCRRADQYQVAHLRGITQGEVKSNVAAMRTGHESCLGHFAIVQECPEIIGFVIRLLRCLRAAVASPVVANCMELFAEGGAIRHPTQPNLPLL